jgi:hypothetical protein
MKLLTHATWSSHLYGHTVSRRRRKLRECSVKVRYRVSAEESLAGAHVFCQGRERIWLPENHPMSKPTTLRLFCKARCRKEHKAKAQEKE